jgi:hypothetical protein
MSAMANLMQFALLRISCLAFLCCFFVVQGAAASITVQVVTNRWQAAANNQNAAYMLVNLVNPDGSAWIERALPGPKPGDRTSGLELKGTKWSFETLSIPEGFARLGVQVVRPQTFFDPAVTRTIQLPGQVRLMQVVPMFQLDNPADPHRGLYYFSILPMFGIKGGPKQLLNWVAGEYIFRMSFRDGVDQGSTLGEQINP